MLPPLPPQESAGKAYGLGPFRDGRNLRIGNASLGRVHVSNLLTKFDVPLVNLILLMSLWLS
jgi:hypothetical protein